VHRNSLLIKIQPDATVCIWLDFYEALNFMKIRLVEVQLIHVAGGTEEHTGMTKIIITFRNFANALKSWFISI